MLAGFPDGRADEGPTAVRPSLLGLNIARERGWTAPPVPEPDEPDESDEDGDRNVRPFDKLRSTLLTPVLTKNWGDEQAWKLDQLRARRRLRGRCAPP